MEIINTKHKDRLFCFIFGRKENSKWTLDLYNALNGTNYENPDDVQIFTIENVLYMGMKNDVALIVEDILSVYEQQSTYNPNMPVRELIYVSKLYSKYIKMNKLNIYSKSTIRLPKPKLIVFYNGEKDKENTILKLSDSFAETSPDIEPDISVNVTMININYGNNADVLNKCSILQEYSWVIDKIRIYNKDMEMLEAVNSVLDEMPDSYRLKPFLVAHKAEVTDMCITEYDEKETLKAIGEEYFAEGKAEGKAEGRAEGKAEGRAEGRVERQEENIRSIDELVKAGQVPADIADIIISKISEN